MTTNITIRPACPADAPALAAIYNEGIEDRAATFETAARSAADFAARLGDARFPVLVAERDGAVVGWAGTAAHSDRPCYAGIAEFSIYVARAARGTGIGTPLLAALVDVAERHGFWKLVSRIFPGNAGSRAVCRAAGFREVGTYQRHAQLDGAWRDVLIVERLIPSNQRGA